MADNNSFVPIQLSTLVGDVPLHFDVYIKVDERCILYVRSGDDIENDRLKALKKKKVRKLYINGSDEPKYQGFLDSLLLSTNHLNNDQKIGLASGLAENASEIIYQDPQSEAAYSTAEKAANNLIDIMSDNHDVLLGILLRDGSDNPTRTSQMHAHAVNVSSLAISFGETLKFSRSQLSSLGVAGLFHDVGFAMMNETDQELFFKDVKTMSRAEFNTYKQHPILGAESLQDKAFANPEVLGLIATHEERINGSGFPRMPSTLNPLQECLALCCLYDRQVTCLELAPETVINDLMVNHIGAFGLDVLKKFKAFMKNVYKLG
ncbi:MAG: HD-GYP domain-containing protein [Bacteriovoracaceae bacterium]